MNALKARTGCANLDLEPTRESFALHSLACAGSGASSGQVREAVAGAGEEEADSGAKLEMWMDLQSTRTQAR